MSMYFPSFFPLLRVEQGFRHATLHLNYIPATPHLPTVSNQTLTHRQYTTCVQVPITHSCDFTLLSV